MLPFKKGAFHLAVQGQFPIVPMVMENYNSIYSPEEKRFESGVFTIRGEFALSRFPPRVPMLWARSTQACPLKRARDSPLVFILLRSSPHPVLPPVSTKGYTSSSEDIAKLSDKVRSAMVEALEDMHRKRNEAATPATRNGRKITHTNGAAASSAKST